MTDEVIRLLIPHVQVGNGTYVIFYFVVLFVTFVRLTCFQIGFLVLTLIGVFLPMCMAKPNEMVRSDGSKVIYPHQPSFLEAIRGLWVTLQTEPWIVLLFPMFFASNWFYTWRER